MDNAFDVVVIQVERVSLDEPTKESIGSRFVLNDFLKTESIAVCHGNLFLLT